MSTLIHVGYGKAASTTLQNWFAKHPEIWEFSIGSLLKGKATDKKVCVLSDERLSLGLDFDISSGLISSLGSIKDYQQNLCRELSDVFPNAHILIVTRGFSQFILSFYSQYVSKGGVLDFAEFIEKYHATLQDLLDYNYLLEIYQKAFGGRVIILPVELLRDDSKLFFSTIEKTFDLSSIKRSTTDRLNQRINQNQILAYPLFSRAYLGFVRLLGVDRRKSVHKFYVNYILRSWVGYSLASCISKSFLKQGLVSDIQLMAFVGLASSLSNYDYYSNYHAEYFLHNQD